MNRGVLNSLLPLLALMLPGCTPPAQTVEISFVPQYAGAAISCDGGSGALALTDLRFFVHDIEMTGADGNPVQAVLKVVPGWQSEEVALVDLENGDANCINGSAATHAAITVSVPDGDYRGLRFSMSVPPHLNHGDPLLADGPLTQTPMHWHWRSGYKFLRAGVRSETDAAWLHLGSSRCRGNIGNLLGCDAGNRPRVWLPEFDPAKHSIGIELSHLFSAAELQDGIERSCQMGPDEAACGDWLPALGLDAAGTTLEPAALFRELRR